MSYLTFQFALQYPHPKHRHGYGYDTFYRLGMVNDTMNSQEEFLRNKTIRGFDICLHQILIIESILNRLVIGSE